MKKSTLAIAVASVIGAGAAQAAPVAFTSTFDMYQPDTVLISAEVDTTVTGFYDLAAMTWGVSSVDPFFGQTWTAFGGQLYLPGSYSISTDDSSYGGETGTGDAAFIDFNVPAGKLGGTIKFGWSTSVGIDVVTVWDPATGVSLDVEGENPVLVQTGTNPFTGDPIFSVASTVFGFDGVPGLGMSDGPFPGFSANFSINGGVPELVPVPAAVWLFGSGLLGLVGVARRKKA